MRGVVVTVLLLVAAVGALDHMGLVWYAPFLSGGGLCDEATAFVLGLSRIGRLHGRLAISHHGDSIDEHYVNRMASDVRDTLISHAIHHVPGL